MRPLFRRSMSNRCLKYPDMLRSKSSAAFSIGASCFPSMRKLIVLSNVFGIYKFSVTADVADFFDSASSGVKLLKASVTDRFIE